MAGTYFFHVLGHVYLAAHTAHDDADVSATLKAAGFGPDKIKKGIDYGTRAEELLERKMLESPDNKTLGHNIHAAVADVEMWLQTLKLKMRKADFEKARANEILGHELHAHDHTVTAIVQGLRAIGVLRSMPDDERESAFGDQRAAHDTVMRGNTLLKKLYKVADEFVTANSMIDRGAEVIVDIDEVTSDMVAWLQMLDEAATKASDKVTELGKAGWLPFGVGLPVGGTSFGVVLHERAKTAAPAPNTVRTSGWSVGRQGNKENLGSGWGDVEVGSVMND